MDRRALPIFELESSVVEALRESPRLILQAPFFSGEIDAGAALGAGHGIVRARFRRGGLETRAAALRAFEREFDLRHISGSSIAGWFVDTS